MKNQETFLEDLALSLRAAGLNLSLPQVMIIVEMCNKVAEEGDALTIAGVKGVLEQVSETFTPKDGDSTAE